MALKNKLLQKSNIMQSEEAVLMRSSKHFDYDNDGKLTMGEWFKSIEKIGVVVPSVEDLKRLFQIYDSDHDGMIDYKEFANSIFRPNAEKPVSKDKPSPEQKSGGGSAEKPEGGATK